jgi:hypothetical protein
MKTFGTYLLLSFILLTGCNQNQQQSSDADTSVIAESEDALAMECFEATVGKDSASLSINNLNGKITGLLAFNFLEKDDSQGEIKGEFKGDTLFVDYTFKTEGRVSKNPLVFLQKDGKLIQGYGEIKTYLGKTYFTDHASLKFQDGFTFEPVDCK